MQWFSMFLTNGVNSCNNSAFNIIQGSQKTLSLAQINVADMFMLYLSLAANWKAISTLSHQLYFNLYGEYAQERSILNVIDSQ